MTEHFDMENGDRRRMLNVKFRFIDQSGRPLVGGIGLDVTDHHKMSKL